MTDQKPLQAGPSTHSDAQIEEAKLNLEFCLAALDEAGEAGLQAAVDKIYGPVNPPNRLIFPGGSMGQRRYPLPDGIVAPDKPARSSTKPNK